MRSHSIELEILNILNYSEKSPASVLRTLLHITLRVRKRGSLCTTLQVPPLSLLSIKTNRKRKSWSPITRVSGDERKSCPTHPSKKQISSSLHSPCHILPCRTTQSINLSLLLLYYSIVLFPFRSYALAVPRSDGSDDSNNPNGF